MKEKEIVKFFTDHGFRRENSVFLGTNNYAFLPFNNSLIVGKNVEGGLLVEGVFKDSRIRSIIFSEEDGVMLDVMDDPPSKRSKND